MTHKRKQQLTAILGAASVCAVVSAGILWKDDYALSREPAKKASSSVSKDAKSSPSAGEEAAVKEKDTSGTDSQNTEEETLREDTETVMYQENVSGTSDSSQNFSFQTDSLQDGTAARDLSGAGEDLLPDADYFDVPDETAWQVPEESSYYTADLSQEPQEEAVAYVEPVQVTEEIQVMGEDPDVPDEQPAMIQAYTSSGLTYTYSLPSSDVALDDSDERPDSETEEIAGSESESMTAFLADDVTGDPADEPVQTDSLNEEPAYFSENTETDPEAEEEEWLSDFAEEQEPALPVGEPSVIQTIPEAESEPETESVPEANGLFEELNLADEPVQADYVNEEPVSEEPEAESLAEEYTVEEPSAEITEPEEAPTESSSEYAALNQAIVQAALSLVDTTNGKQCTEVASRALELAGVENVYVLWPDQYAEYYGYYTDEPEAGNLIYYDNGGRGVDHIAVYIGNGDAVHGNFLTEEGSKTIVYSAYDTYDSYGNPASDPQFIQIVQ